MPTFSTITDGQIDQDSPITQPLMTAYRDNLLAVVEGSSGAPKIKEAWQASQSTTSAGLVLTDIDDGDGIKVETAGVGTSGNEGTISFRVDISSDNGSTFVQEVTLLSSTAPSKQTVTVNPTGTFIFDRPSGSWAFLFQGAGSLSSGTFTSPTGVTDIRFRFFNNTTATNGTICALAIVTGGKATS